MFKQVVVGSDGSAEASDAVVLGAELATATGAELHLLGVFSPPLFHVNDRQRLQNLFESALNEQRDRFAPTATVQVLRNASHTRALIHFSQGVNADVIVVGSSPKAPAGRCAIGRHARQLLHDGSHAVAIAKRGLHEPNRRLHSIGVGYDGGPESKAAVEFAAQLSSRMGSELRVLTVVEETFPVLGATEWMTVDWESLHEQQREEALARASGITAELSCGAGISVAVGDPGLELRKWSDTVDLTVVGSRRWGAIARLVSGSVGETLVAGAGSSVLIVPRPDSDKQRRHRTPSAEHTLA